MRTLIMPLMAGGIWRQPLLAGAVDQKIHIIMYLDIIEPVRMISI